MDYFVICFFSQYILTSIPLVYADLYHSFLSTSAIPKCGCTIMWLTLPTDERLGSFLTWGIRERYEENL
jgi:hypothetical protein